MGKVANNTSLKERLFGIKHGLKNSINEAKINGSKLIFKIIIG